MKLFLHNKGSAAFIEDLGGAWTKEGDRAHVFGSGLEALFFCLRRGLKNMQIVARFRDSRMDFSVPVTDLRGS